MTLSIIIPAFNEASRIGSLVTHLLNDGPFVKEVLVIDGSSNDETAQLAGNAGAKVYKAKKRGRAHQMNQGAFAAKGEVLHFVHADAWPPKGFSKSIKDAIEVGYKAGCFRSLFDTKNKFLLLNSFFTRFPGLIFRGGGQTLFITDELFQYLGGYDESLQLMEEYDLIRRIKRHTKFRIIPRNVLVSVRKYQENGTIRLQASYALIMILFFLNFNQNFLIRLYKRLIQ